MNLSFLLLSSTVYELRAMESVLPVVTFGSHPLPPVGFLPSWASLNPPTPALPALLTAVLKAKRVAVVCGEWSALLLL